MMASGLREALRDAKARGLRPFEIFHAGKTWVEKERLRERGISVEIEYRTAELGKKREGEAGAAQKRSRRVGPKTAAQSEEGGGEKESEAEKELRTCGHFHSHLLSLRRAAIADIRRSRPASKGVS